MINIYKIFLDPPKELSPELITSIHKGIYTKIKTNAKKEKTLLGLFIEKELEYFEVLRDYIYFYRTFIYDNKKIENKDDIIYNKYISFYDGLSVFKRERQKLTAGDP